MRHISSDGQHKGDKNSRLQISLALKDKNAKDRVYDLGNNRRVCLENY